MDFFKFINIFKNLRSKYFDPIGRLKILMLCFYLLCALIIISGFLVVLNSSKILLNQQNSYQYEIFDSNNGNYTNSSSPINEFLFEKVRVLCWVMTNSEYYIKRAQYIKPTWGKRCNKLLIIGSNIGDFQDNVKVPFNEGRAHLWYKTKFAFTYIYDHYFNDTDWFLKVDDDTYVIMENLRYLLYPHDPSVPIYFGCKYNVYVKQGYMSGGAGYVLSKEALRRFALNSKSNSTLCKYNEGSNEDVKIGKCLEKLNVIAGDSRDERGYPRFFPLNLISYLTKSDKYIVWYEKYRYHQTEKDCCSEYTVSFHYIDPRLMYFLDMLLYNVQVYGVINKFPPLPEKFSLSYYKNKATGLNMTQINKINTNVAQTNKITANLTQTNNRADKSQLLITAYFTQINNTTDETLTNTTINFTQTDNIIDNSQITNTANFTQIENLTDETLTNTTINFTQTDNTTDETQITNTADFTQIDNLTDETLTNTTINFTQTDNTDETQITSTAANLTQ